MAQNYNIDPYYDDFNPDKNYHRILFKPGYAVQARELTQSQTILQNQISNFAEAVYSQNTPVSGGKVTTNLDAKYIKLNPTYNNTSVVASDFLNKKITDSTGTILASVVVTEEATGNSLQSGDPATLIVTYLSGTKFSDGMTVYITDGETTTPMATTIGTPGGTTSIGDSSTVSVSRGVFWVISGYNTIQNSDGTTTQYRIGNFVTCLPQTVVLDKYDKTPSLRAGLNIVEETITYIDDESLLDPATGSTNYQAPGADRYKVNLVLETRPLTFGDDDTFIELVRYDAGQTVKQSDNTVYSAIDDYFAKRDYETNGDYIVNDFKLTPVPAANGNSNFYDMIIGKGVAYVTGYRVENQSNYTLTVPRARTLTTVEAGSNNTFINYGSYFVVDYANGNFNTTEYPQVDIHCVPAQTINTASIASYNSTKIGTAFLRNLEYVYNTNAANTKSYVFNAYLNDVVTGSLSSTAATGSAPNALKITDATGVFSSTANAYYGATIRITSGTSTGDVRTIVSYNGSTKTANVDSPFTITPDSTSYFSLVFGTGQANSIVRAANTGGSGTVASPAKKLLANTNINIGSGRLNGIPSGPAILNSAGAPEMIFPLGNQYIANNTINETRYYTTQIWRDKTFSAVSNSFSISTTAPIYFEGTTNQTYYGESFKSLFTVIDSTTGEILSFDSGANTATINTSSSVTFSSAAYSALAHPVTVIASVYASIPGIGDTTGNILKTKSKVTGNTTAVGSLSGIVDSAGTGRTNAFQNINYGQTYLTTNAISSTGAMSLYVSDAIRVTKIIDTGSPGLEVTAGDLLNSYSDVTTSYDFDDGQKDSFYDHASIRLKPGAAPAKGNLFVVYDYYTHSGGDGYFTVSSYIDEDYRKIPSYVAKNGNLYQLRDCVDFRPTRQNGVSTYTWNYKTPPSTTPGNSGGIFFPQNKSDFVCGYNFYYGRKDKLVLTKDSKFLMVYGTPSKNPQYPIEPDGSLLLAQIDLDPYTSYVPGEGTNYISAESTYGITTVSEPANLSVTKILHKRWAKSDITDLQTQVNNLEYYTALSILESNANALQIPDVNGLNRFKNGILVDDFSSFATAETYSSDFNANINIRKKTLGPVSWVTNYPLQNPEIISSYGTASTPINTYRAKSLNGALTNLFMLPYSTFNIAVQQLGSGTISINPFNVVNYEGSMTLNPPLDNWVNTNEVPSVLINDPRYQFTQETGGVNLTNAGDYSSFPGTTQQYNQQAITATNDSYASQTVGINNATRNSSAAAAPLSAQNGYITNEGVKAYIRPQEVIVRAKGLLVNSPLSCWFDGINIDKYMTQPDIIELHNVSGTFREDDIIGFYDNVYSFSFYPIGRVVSAYKYPTNNQTRLYISEYIQTPNVIATANVTNAYFAANGKFLYSSAHGTVTFPAGSNSIISLTSSGTVTGPGISFTTFSNTASSQKIYKSPKIWGTTEAGTILNNYGVWGDNNFGTTYNGGAFRVPITANGTYTIKVVTTGAGSVSFGNSSGIFSPTGSATTVLTAAKNISGNSSFLANTLVQWNITAAASANPSFAAIIYNANNEVVWNTLSPIDLKFDGSTANINGPDGGIYYAGLTTVALSKDSPAISNYYVGCEITIKSTYTYQYSYTATYSPPPPQVVSYLGYRVGDGDPGQPLAYKWVDDTAAINAIATKQAAERKQITILSQTYTFTANITGYDATTKVATLDRPVDIALGTSDTFGNLNSKYSIRGNVSSVAEAKRLGNTIPQLSSNENGEFVGVFSIPGSQFFTGERVFRVDNRNRATNLPESATTYAESTFYAGGIFNISTMSPSVDPSAGTFTRQSKQQYNIVSIQSPMDPLAQSFVFDKKNYPNGTFLNSIKLFFAPFQNLVKPTTPVTLYLVETLNGYPTGKILDYSKVVVDAANIKTSNTPHYLDPNTYTEFTFQSPVYVESGVLYAVVITAGSADYLLYYGGQNEPAISSTAKVNYTDPDPTKPTKIGASPYVGSLFESQNSITWSADQGKSLMFVISACRFDTSIKPTVNFVVPKNLPNRKLPSQGLSYAMNANVVQNLYGTYTPSPVGIHAINLTTTDFTPTATNIDYKYSATLESTRAKTSDISISPGRFAAPLSDEIYLSDGNGPRILLPESNSSFTMSAVLSSTDPYVSPVISDDGTTLYCINYSINNMGIQTAQVQVANGGSGYTNSASIVITSGLTGSNTTNDLGVTDIPVFGYTTNAITGTIQTVYTTYRGSGYLVNPTITVVEDATRFGNSNAVITMAGEQSPTGGNGRAKYVTKKVVLTPSNESGDLRVYYSAYKPFGSEVYVYYRILNSNDNDILENQQWQLMTQVGRKDVYSIDRTNVIEFECAPGYFSSLQPNNAISYTSTANTVYTSFNQFQIKVLLAASDPTNSPILTDIRAIALPPGTGI